VRQRVGEQALGVVVDDAIAGDHGHLRSPCGRHGIFGKFDDVDAAGLRLTEDVGHEFELAACKGGEVGGAGLALLRDEDVDVADAGSGDCREEFASDDRAGEAWLRPDEAELVAPVG
jgi:hypothetical protein